MISPPQISNHKRTSDALITLLTFNNGHDCIRTPRHNLGNPVNALWRQLQELNREGCQFAKVCVYFHHDREDGRLRSGKLVSGSVQVSSDGSMSILSYLLGPLRKVRIIENVDKGQTQATERKKADRYETRHFDLLCN